MWWSRCSIEGYSCGGFRWFMPRLLHDFPQQSEFDRKMQAADRRSYPESRVGLWPPEKHPVFWCLTFRSIYPRLTARKPVALSSE
jgi:hypothetical protein